MGEARDNAETLSAAEFSDLYDSAYRTLRMVAAAQAGAALADDVVQEAAIVAWSRRDRFTRGTDFRAWMAAIVRGVARNQRRGERRRSARQQVVAKRDEAPVESGAYESGESSAFRISPGESTPTVETPAIDPELEKAMTKLSDLQRSCLLLKVVIGHSYEEIAAIVGVPANTARTHVHRARLKLAKLLPAPAKEVGRA